MTSVLDDIDPDVDPCGAAKKLRALRLNLAAGGAPSRVRSQGEEVMYHAGNIGVLDREIARMEALCAAQSGNAKPRRRAFRAGF